MDNSARIENIESIIREIPEIYGKDFEIVIENDTPVISFTRLTHHQYSSVNKYIKQRPEYQHFKIICERIDQSRNRKKRLKRSNK